MDREQLRMTWEEEEETDRHASWQSRRFTPAIILSEEESEEKISSPEPP